MTDRRTGHVPGPIDCDECSQPIPADVPAFRVMVYKRPKVGRRRRPVLRAGLVCTSCFDTGQFWLVGRTAASVTVSRTGNECEGCGRLVVLGPDPCRTAVYCNPICKATAWRARKRDTSANDSCCVVCGTPMPGARSNRKTCSAACRQKAYRNRMTGTATVTDTDAE